MNILVTGASGFIGREVVKKLLKTSNQITIIVRPEKDLSKLGYSIENIEVLEIDLADTYKLKHLSENFKFDAILHIGAVRGGRKFPNETYYQANVEATKILSELALKNKSKFIFCSSVGVFGAIPDILPASNKTPVKRDNYYHITKILCEEHLNDMFTKGLEGAIIRPAITYGEGDYGFPFSLINLIDKKLFRCPPGDIKIHMTDVDMISDVFIKALSVKDIDGKSFIVADSDPVSISELSNFINNQLRGENYHSKHLPTCMFRIGEFISKMIKNELWTARFQLISRSWYYDVNETYEVFNLMENHTIPNFMKAINWFKIKEK